MAEGVIVVPLYARQAAAELAMMMKDCSPARFACRLSRTSRLDFVGMARGAAGFHLR